MTYKIYLKVNLNQKRIYVYIYISVYTGNQYDIQCNVAFMITFFVK